MHCEIKYRIKAARFIQTDMEDNQEEAIQGIRETNRYQTFLNRRKQKDEETDLRRSLGNLQLNTSDVTTITNKLKTKTSITATELKLLQNALIDVPDSIEVVLNTHGALRGLVRELTGHDVSKQIASCGCLCNLALGDSRACCTIAKAVGAYLVASLDSLTTQLAVSCAWTLGNLAGSGARACDVISAQGALAKLCDVTRGDVRAPALYALTHVAHALKDNLAPEHLHRIVQSLSRADLDNDSSHLLFILSCHKDFTPEAIPEFYLKKIVEKLPVSIENHLNICQNATAKGDDKCCDLVYLIRFLANLNNCNIYSGVMEYFVNKNLIGHVRRLLEIDGGDSLGWLLGNMYNCCGNNFFFDQLVCN